MTHAEAGQIVGLLVANFPTPEWPQETVKLYVDMLGDLEVSACRDVAMEWIKTRRERPMIADIRRAVAAKQSTTLALGPEDAWGYVQWCLTMVGRYRDFPTRYPLVERAVSIIGWRNLCDSENQVADRAHFLQIYRTLAERELTALAASPGAHGALPAANQPKRIQQSVQNVLDAVMGNGNADNT